MGEYFPASRIGLGGVLTATSLNPKGLNMTLSALTREPSLGLWSKVTSLNGDVVLTSLWGKSVRKGLQGEKEVRKAVRLLTSVSSGFRIPEAVLNCDWLLSGKSLGRKGLSVV